MPNVDEPLRDLFRRELLLCCVHPGERVTVLSAGDALRSYADAFVGAARDLGADVVDLQLVPNEADTARERAANFGRTLLHGDARAMQQLCRPGLVVDLWVASFTPECEEMQRAGARVLLVGEPPEVLARMFPSLSLRTRTEEAYRRLARARELRFVSAAGSDVTYRFAHDGRYTPLMQYGFVDTPGRWDHFPSGLVAHFTPDVNGRVVMAAGDMILPQMKLLSEPIAFTIEAGMVTSIDGGVEAKAIRDTLEGHRDPRAYAVSHIGWGTHPAAVWSNRGMGMDGRSFEAGVLFSLGPNVEFGGENDTACHLDLPMHGCSLWLDGELVFAGGTFVDALPDAAR